MQLDFHYYCIGVLARAAGFRPADALTIAYASQYVDNAVEGDPITVGETGMRFDPVRTAYFGIKSMDWSVHKRVFVPFHFLPPKPLARYPSEFDFVTQPDSPFARKLLAHALQVPGRRQRLCAIGIALHTYADTWAHQSFSGRKSVSIAGYKENDAEKLLVYQDGEWKSTGFSLMGFFAPELGHAEAGFLPDLSFCTWRYTSNNQETEPRDNRQMFMEAAHKIYDWLCGVVDEENKEPAGPDRVPWKVFAPRIEKLFSEPSRERSLWNLGAQKRDLKRRCQKWEQEFGRDKAFFYDPEWDSFEPFHYDQTAWREEAFTEPGTDPSFEAAEFHWEKLRRHQLRALQYEIWPEFWDSFWVNFHRAALKQRHFVLENIP